MGDQNPTKTLIVAGGHPAQQRYLWDHITERLDHLGNRVSPKDRRGIEAALIKKIGRPPTRAQRARLDRQREQLIGKLDT